MSQLLPFLVGFGILVVVTGGLAVRARLRRQALAAGRAVRLGARMKGTASPYPNHWRAGALVVDGPLLGWSPRGTGAVLALGSRQLDVLGVRPRQGREWSLNESALVITARDRQGALVHLAVHEAELENTLTALREATGDPEGAVAQVPQRQLRRVPAAAAVVLAVAAVLTALLGYLYGAGRTVEATVTRYDEAFCSITWSDPWNGRAQQAGVDCAESSRPGSTVQVVALPAPFRGEAIDLYDSHWFSGGALAVLWLGGVAGIAVRTRTRRAEPTHPAPAATDVPVTTLTPQDLSFQAVTAAAHSRRLTDPAPGRASTGPGQIHADSPWWRIPALRALAVGGLLRSLGGVVLLAFALLFGFSWVSAAWDLAHDPTVVETVEVQDWIDGELPLFPHDLYVLIPSDQGEVEALVAAADLPDEPPATVQVRRSTTNPESAELVQGSALTRGVAITAAASAAAVGWVLWVAFSTIRDLRRLRRAARSDAGADFRFVLTVDVEGEGALVLYDLVHDDPRWLLFLNASEHERLPPTGQLRLHGDLREDGVVVAKHRNDTIWPTATLVRAEPDLVCEVVNGLPVDAAA